MSALPTTQDFCLDDYPDYGFCRAADRFVVQRITASSARQRPFVTTSDVPAVRASVSMLPVIAADFRLKVDGRPLRARDAAPLSSTIVELGAGAETWSRGDYEYIHFVLRHTALDEVAADLGYRRVGEIRTASFVDDLVLSRVAKSATSFFDGMGPLPLALDHLELFLAAHLAQQYGSVRQKRTIASSGLPTWKQRRAAELMDANLDGTVRLSDLARECELSVSHFARAFKVSFGIPAHRWLLQRRVARAQQLLTDTSLPLIEIASQSGFRDQSMFTRTFRRIVGTTPSAWRRLHKTTARIV